MVKMSAVTANWFWRAALLLAVAAGVGWGQMPREIAGIYPRLAMFNDGGECGTGAVVPWAGKLWVVTYSPHQPGGSSDKLYEVDSRLRQIVRPESIGGTPANRMIHRESNQLFIGPYAIDAAGRVRAIPYTLMFGRPTGTARHLFDPAGRVYYASMEEGFYEVDVKSLAVSQLYEDANHMVERKAAGDIAGPLLPGYHGKGLYSGQGRLIYSNNGELGAGDKPPDTTSGCLAEWDGRKWTVVRRNQFTEVTGPGGLYGNANPDKDPVWSVGWDHRSVILMLLDGGRWSSYRLPKASHTYDGAHGWNTEWPRIREIGERDLLMTMHGMFWRFPASFSAANSAGVAPRSTYLRVIGDFARWNDRIVLGSDDTANREFLNTRRVKGAIPLPGQAQSNLWFVEPGRLDRLGPPIGRGGVWVDEAVKANTWSEPYLFSGFERRMVHLAHSAALPVTFSFEIDRAGNGQWTPLRKVTVPARGYVPVSFKAAESGAWVRVSVDRDCPRATAFFQYSNQDRRTTAAHPIFAGIGGGSEGWVWARGENRRTLLYAARDGLYELDGELALRKLDDPKTRGWMEQNFAPPADAVVTDKASAVYTDERRKRWRLPVAGVSGTGRIAREVSTERDLLNVAGTFYELPSNNAGGIAMVRPIATHGRRIRDFCSYRGLMVISGVTPEASGERIVRSDDGKEALWLGVSDDLWTFGKPRGEGGPWRDSRVKAGEPSDPYLMTGYDRKLLRLRSTSRVRVEVDVSGTGLWQPYRTFDASERTVEHRFADGFEAYWVRFVPDRDGIATATFIYD
jgi:hypothetical protein